MKRTKVDVDIDKFPSELHSLLDGADIFDSSCSPEARVFYVDKDCGYYVKTNEKGSLKTEAVLTEWFASKGLAPQVV